jgi:predicted alpha/beta hydrolase
MAERLTALTGDGVRLVLRRHRPVGPARAVCLAGHAMMANGSYMERGGFASHLAERGIDLFVLDFRGHGESVPPSPRGGRWGFDDHVDHDLPAAIDAVADATGARGDEICYLGHSLGGLAGLAAFGAARALPPPRRLALWATSVWLGETWQRRALMTVFALSAWPLGYAPARRLRVGSDDEPRTYIADLRRWVRERRWTGRHGIDYRSGLREIRCPVWAVAGEGDRLCRPADAEALRGALSAAAPLRRVGRAHGDAIDPDHFALFTARALRPLWDELARFLAG